MDGDDVEEGADAALAVDSGRISCRLDDDSSSRDLGNIFASPVLRLKTSSEGRSRHHDLECCC